MRKFIISLFVLALVSVGFAAGSATFGVQYDPSLNATAEFGIGVDGGEILLGAIVNWQTFETVATVGLASPVAESAAGDLDLILRILVPVFDGENLALGQVEGQLGLQWEVPLVPVALEGGVQAPFSPDLANSLHWYARAGLSFQF